MTIQESGADPGFLKWEAQLLECNMHARAEDAKPRHGTGRTPQRIKKNSSAKCVFQASKSMKVKIFHRANFGFTDISQA